MRSDSKTTLMAMNPDHNQIDCNTTIGLSALAIHHAVRIVLHGRRARLGRLRGLSLACAVGLNISPAHAELPQICVTCASGAVTSFVTSGAATASYSGNNLTVNQSTASATLNWQSFNISSGSTVNFVQPDSNSVALNRIFQNSASQIFGSLNANGRVYLLNQNGIVFGNGSQVNVSGLIASSLDINSTAINADGSTNLLNAWTDNTGKGTFHLFTAGASGDINIQQGATITTSDGGQVFVFAPNINNAGSITTPGGQTVLAAGNSVFLAASADDNLRGVLVEVGTGGTVSNEAVGRIIAERGSITLAGLAVNQLGRVTATTSVNENGSIRLQARDSGLYAPGGQGALSPGTQGGTLILGQHSTTEVTLASDGDLAVDATEQLKSRIELYGKQISILDDAQVLAKGGSITALARTGSFLLPADGTADDGSRIYLAEGATLDVSGADVTKRMESNVISVELRAAELADSPAQRDGALYGETIEVDIREGTELADISGYVSLIERDVAERNLVGGSITLDSQGSVIVASDATLDISGGTITYEDGFINTSKLLGADGKVYDVADADPARTYTAIIGAATTAVTDARWGVTTLYSGIDNGGVFEQGYVEGKDAGALTIVAPRAVIDGDVVATTTAGRYQRELSGELAGLQRPYDELPLGGQLILGRARTDVNVDQVAGSVRITEGRVLSGLTNEDGSAFDPLMDELPDSVQSTVLRSELFGDDAITRARIYANDDIVLTAGTSLQMGQQGELLLQAGNIDLSGDISAASGNVTARATTTSTVTAETSLHVAGSSHIDVAGNWVNDSLLLNVPDAQPAALTIDGGTVTLSSAQGSLLMESGSVIDVSGGAWAQSDGDIVAGDAGSISLTAQGDLAVLGESVELQLDGQLLGYGVEDGARLTLRAPEICIAGDGHCGTDDRGTVTLTPDALLAGGFGSITLQSNERGVQVESGTTLDLQQQNLIISEAALTIASSADMDAVGRLGVLPDYQREAMDLSLVAGIAKSVTGSPYNNTTFADVSGLEIAQGAVINGDVGATINLQSNSTLVVDGEIHAAAGDINLVLDSSLSIGESIDAQGIWLSASSVLDVSGATILQPDSLGLRVGDVLDGGSITLSASRGSVVINPGAQLDLSGDSSVLDIRSTTGGVVATQPALIASEGGTLNVTAADAILMNGTINAQGGSAAAQGGTLSVTMDANNRGASDSLLLPAEGRSIVVSESLVPVVVAAGSALPDQFAGSAWLSSSAIEAAGFDSVNLTAQTTLVQGATQIPQDNTSRIELNGDVSLSVGREIIIDAARITGNGLASLDAAYVALGHTDIELQGTPLLAAGAGQLTVTGELIDVIGNSVIDGFSEVTLDSAVDIRLLGIQQKSATTVQGSLQTNADLLMRADQVYASTLSDFEVAVTATDGVLRIEGTGDSRDDVLSAGSHLTLSAPVIEQAGVVRAPFGTIEFEADRLTLQSGSLTSTSAEGLTIPFGQVQAGTDWVYQLEGQTLVAGDTLDIPEQRIVLAGDMVSVDSGAVIDVSGGGDLLGYEFVPGTGGSTDVLASATRFAIVPALNLTYAPYDTQESADTSLSVGDTIHLSAGVNGLPAGDYVLLPARYALLEGAYVVELADGYTDLQPGEVLNQLNGSSIVSGYQKVANTAFADARTSGFLITPSTVVAGQAQYDTYLASEFFAASAEASGVDPGRLMNDAGVVSIAAISALNIDGELRARAAAEGRGAAVDISADQLVVSDSATAGSGEVVVSASDLNALGAESILLGGSRTSSDSGVLLDVSASRVTVAGDAQLAAPELLIVASDSVSMLSGATLTAITSASGEVAGDTYLLQGDGAALRLAAGEQASLQRDNEAGLGGTLLLAQGAQLIAAGGSLALDASVDVDSSATLSLPSGSLSLGASRINLSDNSVTAAGLTLDAGQLSNLELDQLTLVSRSSIDVYGDVALGVTELHLDAAGIRNQDGASASLTADTIVLGNTADRTDADATTVAGTLQFHANEIVLSEGVQRFSGYQDVALIAESSVRGESAGGLSTSGSLTIVAPVLLAETNADTTIAAAEELRVISHAASGTASDSLGGSLQLQGAAVYVAGRIEAGAGSIDVRASTGDVTLLSGAVLDVAGRSRDFDGEVIAGDAGSVNLSAGLGNVLAQVGSVIDVSAVENGAAGALSISAVNGSVGLSGVLNATAIDAADSGVVVIDARSLGDFSALNTALNAAGFNAQRELRQRSGNVSLAASDTLSAQQVKLTADAGSLLINGVIDARGESGGDITLSASNDVVVNGSLLASASSDAGAGGSIDLLATTGGVKLTTSSLVDTSAGTASTSEGELNVRVMRDQALTLVDADATNDAVVLAGTFEGVGQTTLEAYQRYTGISSISASDVSTSSTWYTSAASFISNNSGTIKTALGRSGDADFRLLAGIEIQSNGDLTLNSDWNLNNWRFGDGPGVLTLRAAGNLTFNRSLSDGFNGVTGSSPTAAAFVLPTTASDSWSYRLVAGADRDSADVLAVNQATSADVTIAAGTVPTSTTNPGTYRMVRTGNGSIDVAASGDFVLGNQASVLYTAGVASADGYRVVGATVANANPSGRAYPVDGGDISISVKGDIQGAATTQLYTDWLWRAGRSASTTPNGFATGWTINFARFMQNVGALAGGDVSISAGGNISDLSVSIPSIGQQVGGGQASSNEVKVIGGGNMTVVAGGDILGGNYFIGLGDGELQAGGSLLASTRTELYPILGLGDGDWSVSAGESLGIEAVLNPTLVPQAQSQTAASQLSVFSTYADDSTVQLKALTGSVLLSNDQQALTEQYTSINWNSATNSDAGELMKFYAPQLRVTALSADIELAGDTSLFPAAGGSLALLAEHDIHRAEGAGSVEVVMPDIDLQLLPSIDAPLDNYSNYAVTSSSYADVPVHAEDESIVHMVARTGDIDFEQILLASGNSDTSLLSFATPVRLYAGGDIIDLPLTVQHDAASDVSSIEASGNLYYTVARNQQGSIVNNSREIVVDGPGALLIAVGGDVDLQTAAGISSRGNLQNTNLAENGASIQVLAGLNGRTADYAAFEQAYLVDDDVYASMLDAYVQEMTGTVPGNHASALQMFATFTQQQKAPLLNRLLIAELRASAEIAASVDPELNGDYSRGFAAMNTLFPDEGQYSGDIALYFSRIYTRDGGGIVLLTPGGKVNAGLASPPSAFGVSKQPFELGVVTQRGGDIGIAMDQDLQVNQSRVFAINNSDIVVWSSNGDIDAGRGAKTAISAPEPDINYDPDGRVISTYSASLAGSGIQTRNTTDDYEPGDVVLAAPRGIVNAGDAGIVAGNLTIAATAVVGTDNIKVSGVSVGVPIDAGGLGASLSGVSAAASGAAGSAASMTDSTAPAQTEQAAPLAAEALSWLEVFVVGLGEDNCKQDDLECLKRQR